MLSYEPITRRVKIDYLEDEHGPDAYPHLARAFDIHSKVMRAHIKDMWHGEIGSHRLMLTCSEDRPGKLTLVSLQPLWRTPEMYWFWQDTRLPEADHEQALSTFRDAIDKSDFDPSPDQSVLIGITGRLTGLSHHDLMRLEALDAS